jgi:hypothetical protein
MSKSELNALCLAPLLLASTLAMAEDLAPGLWSISMESRVQAETGWTPAPFNLTQCLQSSDAKDPSRLISSIASPGATGCTYTERNYSGSTFRFALECAGTLGIKSRGTVTFSANSFEGSMSATTDINGKATEFQNRLSGKRVGDC